ncbi:cilia- and flagella-associated protein 53-like [Sitophilus oryzae]|uniref:Cilia- and flagella-associated protein 53-like n=1 Tax=Sitophilus oryzae TaxID=7048 RepID=A0A6J2YUX9_SITOR|nr:cilia- and flagella-associated protein 53-like [Sitophilus oryzae]
MKAYDDIAVKQDLLCKEERQYYYETVDSAQKGSDLKMEEKKQRAEMLKAKREAERLEIVHQKRIEQYRQRCQELRPHLAKKNLMESKYSQLQQMRENEARRESDRELDQMWHELTMKEIEAKLHVWDSQVKQKEMKRIEMNQAAVEERMEMEKVSEQLRREEIEVLDAKRRKRDAAAKELLEQIAIEEQLHAQRKKEEDAVDRSFNTLAQLELEREKAAIQDTTAQAKRETALYRKHLKQLEEERKLEEKKLMELLDIHRKQVEAKQAEARCKVVEAKRKLQQDVLMERAEQLKYKKQEAEEQLKHKEAENELLKMAYETNERLQAESDRLEKMATMQYRADLNKQIEYNNVLRLREKEELERQLAEGQREEEKYRKIVQDILMGEIEAGVKHPFRRAMEQTDCYCPKI